MNATYDPILVVVSILVAIFASYTALDLANSLTLAAGRARTAWLWGGALAMGVGIWSMHFIGMLAYSIPGVVIAYDVPLLALSVLVAILASVLALFVVSRQNVTTQSYSFGSLLMAAAISGMHYIGMAAMRMPGRMEWNRTLVVLSILIALVASFAALRLAFRFRSGTSRESFRYRLAAGIFMGLAITGMHYTGMLAATHVHEGPSDLVINERQVLATWGLAVVVTGATLIILGIALAGSIIDRALALRSAVADQSERAREHIASILESITDAFFALDREWRFTYVNKRALDHFAREGRELIGNVIWEVFPTLRGSLLEENLRKAQKHQRSIEFELRPVIFDTWMELHVYPSAEGLSIYFQDISERKHAADAQKASEERLRLAIATAQLATFEVNFSCETMEMNQRGRDICGFSATQPLTFSMFQERLYPEDRIAAQGEIARALDPRGPKEFDLTARICGEGAPHWIRARGQVIFEEGVTSYCASRCIGTFIDVTAQREINERKEELLQAERRAREEAERSSRMKDEFVATLSHELRTPLNSILGWAHLLQLRAAGNPEIEDGLITIKRNARAQAQLVDDLLDMSRVTLGKMQLDVAPTDLKAVAAAALESTRPAALAKGITLDWYEDPDSNLTVYGDPSRLQQVTWNLLSNAVKFTERGGRVSLQVFAEGEDAIIRIRDTGIGIRPDFIPFLFERFSQADPSISRRHGGLGIGLALVRRLVEMHGGTVAADSGGEGAGSSFTVRLPKAHLKSREAAPKGSAMLEEARQKALSKNLSGIRVLVVDDERDTRILLDSVLKNCKANTESAESSSEALEKLSTFKPHLLVSDIGMPGKTGYDLIKEVRARGYDAKHLPALALTAYASKEDCHKALLYGFQRHLAKPVDPVELIETVKDLAEAMTA